MSMKKCAIMGFAFLAIAQVEAALPPLYQTSGEIIRILSDEELREKLHAGEPILKIERNETGYGITTNQHFLQVDLIYHSSHRLGPAHYTLHFEDPTPLP